MKKIALILIIILFSNFSFSQSQQKTPYQKRIEKINVDFCRLIGIGEDLIKICKAGNDFSLIFNSQEFSYKVHALGRERSMIAVLAFTESIKEAQKLKNEIDFKREKKEAEEKEKKKQEEASKIEEQQKIKEIKENEERLKQEYENSDFVQMKKSIIEDVKEWISKGEFEKSEDYNYRIVNESKNILDEIVFSNAKEYFNKYDNQIKCSLLSYNADFEIFPIETKYNNNVGTGNSTRQSAVVQN